jgi:hypothetical protein
VSAVAHFTPYFRQNAVPGTVVVAIAVAQAQNVANAADRQNSISANTESQPQGKK